MMTAMTGRPRTASDQAIFRAISEVIEADGPAGLTLAAIAGRVGISAPALTQRFGTKRRMLLAYADASTSAVADLFEAERNRGVGPLATLHSALAAFAGPTTTRTGMANSLAFLQLDLTDPDFGRHAARQSAEVRSQIHRLLQEAIDSDELSPALDTAVLAELVYTTYNGALITWAIDGSGPLERWLNERLESALAPHRRR